MTLVETTSSPLAEPEPLSASARRFADEASSVNTRRAYTSDWQHFEAWCEVHERQSLPATSTTLAGYIAQLAEDGYRASTITRHVSAVARAHRLIGQPSPLSSVARETLAGVRRSIGTASGERTSGRRGGQAAPVSVSDLRKMTGALGDDLLGTRDRALLLVGFAGAFRRSELVSLDVSDLAETGDGYTVTIRRSKTDQEGAGRSVGIPYGSKPETCPVRALRRWLEASEITGGPIFRPLDRHGNLGTERLSDRAVARVVQRSAEAAGFDPTRYSGHSLRAGLATEAARAGVSEHDIARTTGHRSTAVLRRYIRSATVFERNAASAVGL